jgi:mannose-6-phosphate isomerase
MANSDNVLRGGLTPKHVDVPELLSLLVFEGRPPEVLTARESGPGERAFRTPVREFELCLLDVAAARPFLPSAGRGVEILLALRGDMVIRCGPATIPFGQGRSAFVPASVPSYTLEGEGRVCRARVP